MKKGLGVMKTEQITAKTISIYKPQLHNEQRIFVCYSDVHKFISVLNKCDNVTSCLE